MASVELETGRNKVGDGRRGSRLYDVLSEEALCVVRGSAGALRSMSDPVELLSLQLKSVGVVIRLPNDDLGVSCKSERRTGEAGADRLRTFAWVSPTEQQIVPQKCHGTTF